MPVWPLGWRWSCGGGAGSAAAAMAKEVGVAVAILSTCQLYNSSCLLTTIKRGDSLWQVLFTERIRMTLPRTMHTPDDLPKQVQVAHDRSRNYEEKGELRLWFMVIYTTLTYRPSSRVARGNNHLEMQINKPSYNCKYANSQILETLPGQ